jgi:DNA-directed RNA polymerase specialized sigma subunit
MDLVQIAVEGLISAVDKFVLPFSRAFRAVAIGRITGNFITSYSLHQDTVLNPCGQKPKKLKDFKYGDVVLGIDNFGDTVETEVVALHDHGVLKSFEITFDDGYRVTCSKNHKFLTKNGMVSIQEIVSGDMEVLCEPAAQAGWVDSPLREGIWNQKRVFRAQESVRDLLGNRSTEASFGNIYGTRQERNAGAFGHELFYQRGETQRGVEGLAYSYAPLTSTGDLVLRKVVRVRSVGLCRMYDLEVAHPKHNFLLPNGVVTSNSETPIHFYPREKRKIYRANKAVGRGSIDHEEIACEVNKGVEKVHCTTASEISNLMSAASVVSADASSQEEGTSVSIRQIERYAAPVESQPDVITEKNDVMAKLFVAETKLSTTQRKVLKLRGVEVDSL